MECICHSILSFEQFLLENEEWCFEEDRYENASDVAEEDLGEEEINN